jgi:hypothetical protein
MLQLDMNPILFFVIIIATAVFIGMKGAQKNWAMLPTVVLSIVFALVFTWIVGAPGG